MWSGTCERNGERETNQSRGGRFCMNTGEIRGAADTLLGGLGFEVERKCKGTRAW